jgi:hypothetical protein
MMNYAYRDNGQNQNVFQLNNPYKDENMGFGQQPSQQTIPMTKQQQRMNQGQMNQFMYQDHHQGHDGQNESIINRQGLNERKPTSKRSDAGIYMSDR